jgi:hypothetical protein
MYGEGEKRCTVRLSDDGDNAMTHQIGAMRTQGGLKVLNGQYSLQSRQAACRAGCCMP